MNNKLKQGIRWVVWPVALMTASFSCLENSDEGDVNILTRPASKAKTTMFQGRMIGDYDYYSIMHYRYNGFSKNVQPTIEPKQAGVTLDQRYELSNGDIGAGRYLYGSP